MHNKRTPAVAGDVRPLVVMGAIAMKVAFKSYVVPAFEASTGLRVEVIWQPTTVLMRCIREGHRADMIVAIDESLGKLEEEGLLEPQTRTEIANAVLGIAVRSGTPHPDISTVAAFRDSLLEAKGVAYSTGGASGIYFSDLISRLGISENLAAVTIPAGFTAEKLVTGEADLAVQQISELISVPGVEVVGPFPDEIQSTTNFSAAIFESTSKRDEAALFLNALVSRAAHDAYTATGLVSRLSNFSM